MINPKIESDVATLLPPHPRLPSGYRHWGRRRFRGQHRYYQRIQREAEQFVPDLAPEHWYDFWHYHADWPGYGNLGWKHRKAHLATHCQVFLNFVRLTMDYTLPFQLWLWLNVEDSGQDATYFHTPNPNGDGNHFPLKLSEVQWGLPALEGYLSNVLAMPMRAGVQKYSDGSRSFYIYSPKCGEPLE